MTFAKTILAIVTSHDQLDGTDKKTGYWVSEIAHPYNILKSKYNFVFASPKGGKSPVDPGSLKAHENDKEVQLFLDDSQVQEMLANTVTLESVKDKTFDAVFYPGGHGPMYDLKNDPISHHLGAKHFELGLPVAALCHGPAAIVSIKLSDGSFMIKGKKVTGFTNTEEDAVGLTPVMPFLLETEMKKNGGLYLKAENWASHVAVDGNLITGQNPSSAEGVALALDKMLS